MKSLLYTFVIESIAVCVHANVYEEPSNGLIAAAFPLRNTSPCHLGVRVTLSWRFTIAASGDTADDRALSSLLIHLKEKWMRAVGCRQDIHLSSNYARNG